MTTKIPVELSSTPGIVDNSDATAITISSSEQVMIGTTDAGYPDYGDSLTLGDVDGGGGNAGMTIRSGTSSYGTFYFSDATGTAAGTYAGKMQYNHSNNSMIFGTNSSDRLTIDSSGNVDIADGNLVVASGHGIDFSATANSSGSMASELLDDYEEGTFTPVYTSTGLSVTHDIQNGLYTKIGDTVHFWILLGTDAVSGTGSSILQITGLPYTCKNTASSFVSGAVGLAYTFASNEQNMKWFIGSNTSLIALYDGDSNVGGVFPSSKLGTTSNDNRLYISGSYKTD